MAIDDEIIRNAMRARIIKNGIFDEGDFRFENVKFDPSGKNLWVRETWIGGDEEIYSTASTRMATALVEYDIYAKADTGTLRCGRAALAIENEFNLLTDGAIITVANHPELDIMVYKTGVNTRSEDTWYVQSVLLYLRVINRQNLSQG